MRPRTLILLLGAFVAAIKLYCAATTKGTADVQAFKYFAEYVAHRGLANAYQNIHLFNHPPLIASLIKWTMRLARRGSHSGLFGFYLRSYSVIADYISLVAIVWLKEKTGRPSWGAIALFAASPIHFAISGFHGNTDSILAMFVLLSAIACMYGRPIVCGVLFGLACNVKVAPLLLFPALFFLCRSRRDAVRFSVVATFITLAGWAPGLLTAPGPFVQNVLCYSSVYGNWGFSAILRMAGVPGFNFSGILSSKTHEIGAVELGALLKLVIILLAIAIPWRLRRTRNYGVFAVLALVWTAFFALTPGFASQYFVWMSALLLLASDGWFVAYTFAGSAAVLTYYTVNCGFPWDGWQEQDNFHQLRPLVKYLLLLAWVVSGGYFAAFVWKFISAVDSLPSTIEAYLPMGQTQNTQELEPGLSCVTEAVLSEPERVKTLQPEGSAG